MATPTAPAAEEIGASFPVPVLRRLAAALHYRDFRVLWAGAFTSSIGTWMQRVTQNWLVLTIAGPSSAFFLGLDSFLGEAPILLFTLIGGVVADRRDRRQLLLTSQYVQMATAFTLAALVYWDVIRIWHVLTLSVVTGVAQAFGGPAYQSLVPSLIDKTAPAERDRAQLDSVQPGAGDRTAHRGGGADRVRNGGLLRTQRRLVSRGHRGATVAAHSPHSDDEPQPYVRGAARRSLVTYGINPDSSG